MTTTIPRMRTVQEAARELKALDDHTAMTPYHIRRLCLDGILPTVRAGKKILFNMDTLIEYMQDPSADRFRSQQSAADVRGIAAIRRLS